MASRQRSNEFYQLVFLIGIISENLAQARGLLGDR